MACLWKSTLMQRVRDSGGLRYRGEIETYGYRKKPLLKSKTTLDESLVLCVLCLTYACSMQVSRGLLKRLAIRL